MDVGRFVVGLLAAAAVAAAARSRRSLSAAGAVAATLVGGAVVGGAGWYGGVLVVLFFATSSALSRSSQPGLVAVERRGSERDAVQVLANGGVAALLALAIPVVEPAVLPALAAGFAGAIAAATADTWSTEVGTRLGGAPRSVLTGRVLPPGSSGGVSRIGTVAGITGAALVAAAANFGSDRGWMVAAVPALAVVVGGVLGGLADSVIGASLQAAYRCPACDVLTEQVVHRCGTPTVLVRGVRWLDNDAVNLLATATGAVAAAALAWAIA